MAGENDEALIAAVRDGDSRALDAILGARPSLAAARYRFPGPDADLIEGTLLHLAVIRGQAAAVERLLAHGAPIDARSSEGRTALHHAFGAGRADIHARLIEAGAEIDACMAAACGYHECLIDILERDPAQVEDRTTGLEPMTWARFGRQTGSMRILAEHGAGDQSILAETSTVPEPVRERAAAAMLRLTIALDESLPSPPRRLALAGLSSDCGYITMTAARPGNLAQFCGRPAGLADDGIERITRLFGAEGADRYSVSLTPGPDFEQMRAMLIAAGLKTRGAKQAVLVHDGQPVADQPSPFALREVSAAEVRAHDDALRQILWPEGHARYVASAGRPGFTHFIAFDGDQPVATGVLGVEGDLGCLMLGATAVAFRGRGAQQALIRWRLARAAEVGCALVASETEQVLVQSYRNLRRCGFELAYEKELFACNPLVA